MYGQAKVDLDRSVPLWVEIDPTTNLAKLKWIADENANSYQISEVITEPNLIALGTVDGEATEFFIGELIKGKEYGFHVAKGSLARGIIKVGNELPAVHDRGRCLIVIDDLLTEPLSLEITQLIEDIQMDGWQVDTLLVSQSDEVTSVKMKILDWYDSDFTNSQSLFLLGHVPVPYSGNSAHDGHTDHQGAWAADVFYGEIDGFWRDVTINNTTPSREKNKNVPFDGKYDQTLIPSDIDIEVGRVDFHDLPAFPDDEIELTRQYLIKSHDFKVGNKDYPRRALVENNFGGFAEGFGQSGWRNFTTMFGGDQVSVQNYDVVLTTDKYLCSYACGGGSYTSCSGVGSTSNLWAAKDIQTVFTMTFGSYFGDWDSQNNFLRSALASGDVLTNAWAGRPVWHLYHMSLGRHIGYSTKETQNATGPFYSQSFSTRSAHIALMGDPTLRLHAVKRASNLSASFTGEDVQLEWLGSPDASHGYFVYRRSEGMDWQLIAQHIDTPSFLDYCAEPNTTFEYMVKAAKLEYTGSGSYFNTSLGITTTIQTGENPLLVMYYADADMDGFGNPDNFLLSCAIPPGFTNNGLDCDDTNSDIYPEAEEIPNNGIDEDCDGEDLLLGSEEFEGLEIKIYPNPANDYLSVRSAGFHDLEYKLYNALGIIIKSGKVSDYISVKELNEGVYYLEIADSAKKYKYFETVIIQK
jgi:hypothetical protein